MKNTLLSLLLVLGVAQLLAQSTEKSAAQANNPLADMTAVSFHNYYMPKLTDASDDMYLNNAWVRFAKPFAEGKFLLRVSTPINTIGMPSGTGTVNSVNGLGDVNAFASYNFVSKPTITVGAGPMISFPTATDPLLGAEKWQGGAAIVVFVSKSPVFQYGGLLTWQSSFAGEEDREDTNLAAVQPFYFWQLGKGTYLRGAPVWAFDIAGDKYHVPLALGIGKVVAVENVLFNMFVEPQYSMLHKGTQPQFQLLTGINVQIMKKK